MNELKLVTSEKFGEVPCAFYQQDGSDEVLLTREQIGTALEYSNPRNAIKNIHTRHQERLDKYSIVVPIEKGVGLNLHQERLDKYSIVVPIEKGVGLNLSPTPSDGGTGGEKETVLYTRKGVMEICRWSKQPKADAFMDFVWDIADKLIKGEAKVVPTQEPATQAMEDWTARVERISDGLDRISRQLSSVERSTSFSNYYLRLQARSGYDRTWERRAIRNVKAIASYIGMEEKTLLRKIYREMPSKIFTQDIRNAWTSIRLSFPLKKG